MTGGPLFRFRFRPRIRVLAGALLFLLVFRSSSFSEPTPRPRGSWEAGRDYSALLQTLEQSVRDSDLLVLFSSRSLFEDVIARGIRKTRLVWVVPETRGIGPERLESLRGYLSGKAGEERPAREIPSIRLENGTIVGTVEGHPFEVVPFHRYATGDQAARATVVAESSYPYLLYENEAANPLIRVLLSYASLLQSHRARGARVLLLDSDRTGLPPRYRYFSNYIAEVFRHPEMIGKEIPEGWRRRANGEYLEFFFEYRESLDNYRKAKDLMPEDPAIHCQIAHLLALAGRPGYRDHLDRAFRLDPSFFDAYLETAVVLHREERKDDARNLLEHARKMNPSDPRASEMLSDITKERPR